MPSLSGPQHRAMEAAAHGISTLGIPKKVGEEFSKADKGKTFDQASLAPNAAIAAGAIRMSKKPEEDDLSSLVGDASFSESDHPRSDNGQFGSGGGSKTGSHGGPHHVIHEKNDPNKRYVGDPDREKEDRQLGIKKKPEDRSAHAGKKEISSEALSTKLKGMSTEKLRAAASNKDIDPKIRAHVHREITSRLLGNDAVAAGVIRFAKKPAADTSVPGMLRMLGGKDAAKKIAAGTIFQAPDGSVLLLKRGGIEGKDNFVGHWALPGGGAEPGETADQCARREAIEEMGSHEAMDADGDRKVLAETDTPNGMRFTTFLHKVFQKFEPKLNSEHTEWTWAKPGAPPSPLHPQVAKLLEGLTDEDLQATDSAFTIAMDRDIQREKTRDGRLIIQRAHITKANVCPYRGEEIPGWEKLGLDPQRVYKLLRDPEEIRKAAPSLNGVQLLIKHTPVNAQDPHQDKTVGSIGTDAEFDGEYLDNSVYVNVQEAIDGIESGKQRELSAGYHYVPDMTPGNFRGTGYDGVMRELCFNHVALVEDGRVGPDAAV